MRAASVVECRLLQQQLASTMDAVVKRLYVTYMHENGTPSFQPPAVHLLTRRCATTGRCCCAKAAHREAAEALLYKQLSAFKALCALHRTCASRLCISSKLTDNPAAESVAEFWMLDCVCCAGHWLQLQRQWHHQGRVAGHLG
jgi:hypothetical protein